MTNIIHSTDYAVQSLRDKMSNQSLIALADGVLGLLAGKHAELDMRLSNDIATFKATVATDVTNLETMIQQAQDAADILGATEVGQIEDILLRLVNADAIKNAIGSVNITLAGTEFTLSSVVSALAMAEQEAKGEVLFNAANTDVVGYRMELSNGQVVLFDVAKVTSADGSTVTATFSALDYAGVPASFEAVYLRNAVSLKALGSTLEVVTYDHKSRTNLLINLVARFIAGTVAANPVPDANANGVVGN